MIKKILTLLIGLMLLMPAALGFNSPPTPMPFVTYYNFNGPVIGLNVEFTCNGNTITKTTNERGGIHVELSNAFGPKCTSIVSVNCGYDVCNKQYNVDDLSYDSISYQLTEAPPMPSPEPEPTEVEDNLISNTDNTIASVESNFGECIDVVITDSKLSKLFDGIIDFDTEEYDTHEEITVKACSETSLDDPDYGLDPYVLFDEGAIEYKYVFDDVILFSTDDDEELEINFLDEDIEIISLSATRMTIRHGELFGEDKGCVAGREIIYNDLPLKIISVREDNVYLSYNGESKEINEDDIDDVGGIEVYVDIAAPNDDREDYCSIRISEDIEEVIEDGDEYDENWDYIVGDGFIGLTNSQDFKYLDEPNKPLKLGDKITLPNDFAVIKFNEITTSETTEIDIRIKDIYLNVKGERADGQDDAFSFNNEDYTELFVGDTGILDVDKVLISNKVRIGESDVYLEKGSIIIGDLKIELGFMDILYKGVSFDTKGDNYLTYEGIIFKNPEGSIDNEETFEIIVPDEIPEITLTIGVESETVGVEPEQVTCPAPTEAECKETVCETTYCPDKLCPPPVCEEQTCPEDGDLAAVIITGILSALGGAGIFFKLFNNKIFTGSNTGLKTYRGKDGNLKLLHKHPGTSGYHNPDTQHRAPETHPKGMIDVSNHYQKNSKGEWEYR